MIDGVSIVIAMVTAQLSRFGTGTDQSLGGVVVTSYWLVTALLGIVWWFFLRIWGSSDIKVLGAGPEEYKRVAVSSLYLFGSVAIVSYSFSIHTARGYIGVAMPLGIVLLLISRWICRKILVRHRNSGRFTRRIMLVGSPAAVDHLHRRLGSVPGAGYLPVAVILPGYQLNSPSGKELNLPVASVGSEIRQILEAVESYKVDAIAISAGTVLKPRVIRQLGWELQERRISMIMAPALTDIAGPRIHTQPVAGLPLIHVSTPELEGSQAFVKRAFDCIGAVLGLIILSPLFLFVALLIKKDSPGPIFFHQERIGRKGVPFKMHKFRSMVVDAEDLLADLQTVDEGNGVLFKMKTDPRITKIGAFIRRYSIDELPQLWNVLTGEMSMVGPRPPLQSEVETYEEYVLRRLKVKPGVTGLWQVSGRSDLSWDDSVRLDLYYVENWSLTQDLIILFRTAKAVFGKDGAY
ncbi:sugar transferase [Paeniglutamicibacter psychrophenolicus]|uniref:sugar transferase n=1 Tax=Paeniglutamicibacter psychrophenolicus TaxID=257454 RepID=UPI00278AC6F8|nr:sugar transferase [Paeniglutamicibacter psychrophenolicus]MDQ0094672.1 exopolysaccharide biosynthesis polyprenyl glycosylphosphotransferase [Paeniglutamicibacter psychrophenolicus]